MKRMSRNQRQESGDGSQQIQVAGDLVQILGVTEQRAVEIAREQSQIAIQEFTAEASAEANARMEKFDEKVVGELSSRGLLEVFADPAFQILLRKTQLHAATTSEDADYELLSKLLSERAEKPSKPMHMVTTRAVEVVEYIDPEALMGVMLLWFIVRVGPNTSQPKEGLAALDDLALKLMDGGELPSGTGWLQRLDLMDCIHYQPMGAGFQAAMKKWPDIFLGHRTGYICEGIAPEDVDAFRVKLNRIIPNLGLLIVEHSFLAGRYRINAISSAQLLEALEAPLEVMRNVKEQLPEDALEKLSIQPMLDVFGTKSELENLLLEAKLDAVNDEAKGNLLKYVELELPNLQKLRVWWDNLSGLTEITPVGVAIAFSNAKRFDPFQGFPSLSEVMGVA
jgi:hypothetical protein